MRSITCVLLAAVLVSAVLTMAAVLSAYVNHMIPSSIP